MRVLLMQYFGPGKLAVDLNIPDVAQAYQSCTSNAEEKGWGVFSRFGEDIVGLFSMQGGLFIFHNAKVATVPDGQVSVSYSEKGALRELRIKFDSEEHVLTYEGSSPLAGPDYTENEEDADFGLWLRNMLGSSERRDAFIKWWSKGVSP
ncbi:MAG: hypothetical protein WCJ35_03125 [Planctomycetota bacterium]